MVIEFLFRSDRQMSDLFDENSLNNYLTEKAFKAINDGVPQRLEFEKHVKFLKRHLAVYPEAYNSLDTTRITLLFFAISSLDLLGELNNVTTPEERKIYIDWIYSLQLSKGRDFGVVSFGQRGLGGLLLDIDNPVKDEKFNWIPQYNLQAFFRKKIVPHRLGLWEPVLRPRFRKSKFNRLPGHFLPNTPSFMMDSRNLLCVKYFENDGFVRVWTVSERSRRNFLERFDVKSSVKNFAESRIMSGEFAVVDYDGMLWIGDIDEGPQATARVKCNEANEILEFVSFCDHPRMLAVGTATAIRTIDSRMIENRAACELFKVPEFDTRFDNEPEYISTEPPRPCKIRHIQNLASTSNNFVIVTNYAMHLVDDRFPGSSIFTLRHAIPDGAHKMLVSNTVIDPLKGGEVTSVFMLDHTFGDIYLSKLYHHKTKVWSSTAPFVRLGGPEDYNRLLKRGKYIDRRTMIEEPLRAIAFVEGTSTNQFLLTQTDDGAIWSLRFTSKDDPNLDAERDSSIERIEKYLDEHALSDIYAPVYLTKVCDELKEDPKKKRQIALFNGILDKNMVRESWKRADEEARNGIQLSFEPTLIQERLVAEETCPEECLFSKATIDGYMEGLKYKIPPPEETGIDEVDEEEDSNEEIPIPMEGSYSCDESDYDAANLAQTYSALLTLTILGDDLSRVNRTAILESVKRAQRKCGSFWSQASGSESDMRFVYCAVAICHILHDTDAIDWKKLGDFIKSSLNIDGGIGQGPGDESHGGSTFCAIASLALANRLWNEEVLTLKEIARLVKWALWKQSMGFHGRSHKADDSCYAFWIGATLTILNSYNLVNTVYLREFLMIAQHPHIGGFCKHPEPGSYSDLLHTYFSIAALSLMREPPINAINPAMNVSSRAFEHIAKLRFN
ncbi:unnamed protein product [Caenorhabditis bovis]|uniref:Prenyltransferase alpha-alpha toroid domain-containing protein n=1 Tax=Caenorhabditis bovis TaxID=2654633 RepID=A0A8S1FE26_9PELO|nr:unnamed protein product [Caenorhabditis bovis]